jgi:hypothetical protein
MRGRAFAFIALLCATWVTARIGFTAIDTSDPKQPDQQAGADPVRLKSVSPSPRSRTLTQQNSKRGAAPYAGWRIKNSDAMIAARPAEAALILFHAELPMRSHPAAFLPAGPDILSLVRAPPPNSSAAHPFEVYAYSFWRRGTSAAGTLGNGQYGGSQSAVIAAIPLLRFAREPGLPRLSLTGRVSVAHGSMRERELAAGLRLRPVARIPVQIIAERRMREDRPDAFAALVAGGQSDVQMPLGFRLDGYGQAGFVSGEGGGPFAEVAVQAQRPIAKSGSASLSAGAGIWGGGQDNVMRIDVGPNIRTNIAAGGAQFQLDASWRFRIAGQAQPGNGPAVTLSTSF